MRGFEVHNPVEGNEDSRKNVESYSVGPIQESLNAVAAFLTERQMPEAEAALGRAEEQIDELSEVEKEKMTARFQEEIEAYKAEIAAGKQEV